MGRGLPGEPSPGKVIPRAWHMDMYNAIRDFMKSPVKGDNKTIRVQGTTVSAVPQPKARRAAAVEYKILKIAATDATVVEKAAADYQCDGTADQVEINAAIASLDAVGGTIQLSSGTFDLAASIVDAVGATDTDFGYLEIAGEGVSSTTIVTTGTPITAMWITKTLSTHIHDLAITGDISGGNAPRLGIFAQGTPVDSVRIADVTITECSLRGIHTVKIPHVLFDTVNVSACTQECILVSYADICSVALNITPAAGQTGLILVYCHGELTSTTIDGGAQGIDFGSSVLVLNSGTFTNQTGMGSVVGAHGAHLIGLTANKALHGLTAINCTTSTTLYATGPVYGCTFATLTTGTTLPLAFDWAALGRTQVVTVRDAAGTGTTALTFTNGVLTGVA